MPIVMCQFCEYIGQGPATFAPTGPGLDDDEWLDVEKHEEREHPEELAKLSELEANPE